GLVEAAGGFGARHLEAERRPQHAPVTGEVAGGGEVDAAAGGAAVGAPGPRARDRRQGAAAALDLEPAATGGPVGMGDDRERLVRRQAQRPGERAALRLDSPQLQRHGLVTAKVEAGVDAVAGVGEAGERQAAGRAAFAREIKRAARIVEPVAVA